VSTNTFVYHHLRYSDPKDDDLSIEDDSYWTQLLKEKEGSIIPSPSLTAAPTNLPTLPPMKHIFLHLETLYKYTLEQ
jgi:hypothetical protein